MPNVLPSPRDDVPDAASSRKRLSLRVLLWTVAGIAMATIFWGYQQVDLAIAWITAKLC